MVAASPLALTPDIDHFRTQFEQLADDADALVATMGGHIDASVSSVSNVQSAIESGAVRAIAVSAPRRLTGALANVPTWNRLWKRMPRTLLNASGLAVGLGYSMSDRLRVNAAFTGSSDVSSYGAVAGASLTLN